MKIVIAPDSFKESLAAEEVAEAIAQGVLEVCPDARVDRCPMADGGGGTVAAMVAATGGEFVSADVFGPLGEPIRAQFGLLGVPAGAGLPGELGLAASPGLPAAGERTAVVEMAAASGLHLVPPQRRDPMRSTTYGTGQLIAAAIGAGARHIIIGIGGSATVDGGAGCAQALGVVFRDAAGRPCVQGLGGEGLASIATIDLAALDGRLGQTRISVACDVMNPLTGPDGAAAIYGPQKGATPEMVERLDGGLRHLAELICRQLGIDVQTMPGGGAAGGLGAGLVAFLKARLLQGLALVAETVALSARLKGADLCITGEGRLDQQSRFGKTVVGVAGIAAKSNVPVICIPGGATADAPAELFDAVYPLMAGGVTLDQAMREGRSLLKARAAEALRSFLTRRKRPGDGDNRTVVSQ